MKYSFLLFFILSSFFLTSCDIPHNYSLQTNISNFLKASGFEVSEVTCDDFALLSCSSRRLCIVKAKKSHSKKLLAKFGIPQMKEIPWSNYNRPMAEMWLHEINKETDWDSVYNSCMESINCIPGAVKGAASCWYSEGSPMPGGFKFLGQMEAIEMFVYNKRTGEMCFFLRDHCFG